MLIWQPAIKGKGAQREQFRVALLEESFSHIEPEILQVNAHRTEYCASFAVGTEIDPFQDMPEFPFTECLARSKGFYGNELF